MAIDPLAHKFPSVSPYNFVENNPLRYFDPNGEYKMDANQVNAVVNMLTNYAPKYFAARNHAEQAHYNTVKNIDNSYLSKMYEEYYNKYHQFPESYDDLRTATKNLHVLINS